MPSTLGRVGWTGYTVPPKGVRFRFQSTVRPTLPAVSVAPITATLRGWKNDSSGCRWGRQMSLAREPGDVPSIAVSCVRDIEPVRKGREVPQPGGRGRATPFAWVPAG